MRRSLVALTLLLSAACSTAQEAPNPFTSSSPATQPSALGTASPFSSVLLGFLAPVQRTLNESLSAMTRALQGSRTLGGLLVVLFLSLAYGIFHAAGPGHGKTIVSSYFLANEARVLQVFLVGNLIALVHAVSALSVVLVLSFLIRGIFSTGLDQANLYIQRVSFGIIALIGLFLLFRRIRGVGHRHAHEDASQGMSRVSLRGLLAIAVPAGMIPCPGAVAVIIFALSLQMLWVSVLSVVAMSVGMGMTISLAALLVLLAKRGAVRLLGSSHSEREALTRKIVEIVGASLLFGFGLLLFLSQF